MSMELLVPRVCYVFGGTTVRAEHVTERV